MLNDWCAGLVLAWCCNTLLVTLSMEAFTTILTLHYYYRDSRTDGALQWQRDNERRKKNGLQRRRRAEQGWRKGGTALTPACLFYLGAQHSNRCRAAPFHWDMAASLCSHTIPHTGSVAQAAASPRLLILSEHLSLSLFLSALGHSVWSHTHTQMHLATHTHTHTSSPASICLCPTGSVLFTYLKPCLLSLSLLLINVSLPSAAQQHNFSHPMNMPR